MRQLPDASLGDFRVLLLHTSCKRLHARCCQFARRKDHHSHVAFNRRLRSRKDRPRNLQYSHLRLCRLHDGSRRKASTNNGVPPKSMLARRLPIPSQRARLRSYERNRTSKDAARDFIGNSRRSPSPLFQGQSRARAPRYRTVCQGMARPAKWANFGSPFLFSEKPCTSAGD